MNIKVMKQWYGKFEEHAINICRKYNVPALWDNAIILKDDNILTIAIVSFGAYLRDSNEEKAVDEIVKVFESMFEN